MVADILPVGHVPSAPKQGNRYKQWLLNVSYREKASEAA